MMTNGDQLGRASATIRAIKANIPAHDIELPDRWVIEFNGAVEKIEQATGIDLAEFKVSSDNLKRSVASTNSLTGHVSYRDGLFCDREILTYKIDALLGYFSGLQGGEDRTIGFRR